MINKKNKMRKGFTLVEMLVVIAIVALLVSIVMPVIGTSRVKAAAAANAANLRSIEGQIASMRVLNQAAFERLDFTEINLGNGNEGLIDALGGLVGSLIVSAVEAQADANGVLKISDDIIIEGVPGAKEIKVTDGTVTRDITEGTPMTVYVSESGVAATYMGVTKDDFADIAEDGKLDGELSKTTEEKVEQAWKDTQKEAVQLICQVSGHKDTNGDCVCDRTSLADSSVKCGLEYHPDSNGDGYCDNNCAKATEMKNCTHVDDQEGKKDHKCDKCGFQMSKCSHSGFLQNGKCNYCGHENSMFSEDCPNC